MGEKVNNTGPVNCVNVPRREASVHWRLLLAAAPALVGPRRSSKGKLVPLPFPPQSPAPPPPPWTCRDAGPAEMLRRWGEGRQNFCLTEPVELQSPSPHPWQRPCCPACTLHRHSMDARLHTHTHSSRHVSGIWGCSLFFIIFIWFYVFY